MLLILLACARSSLPPQAAAPPAPEPIVYPDSPRGDVVDDYHGTKVPDPYRWLEDPDSEQTKAWIEAQNRLTRGYLDAVPQRAAIRQRLEELWSFERYSAPVARGGRLFFTYNEGEWEHDRLYVLDPGAETPRMLLDPATLSADGTVSLADWKASWDGERLAYGVSDGGSDWQIWRVLDVDDGKQREDELRWVKFSDVTWTADNAGFFYARYPEPADPLEGELIHQKEYYHRLGDAQAADRLVYETPDQPDWGFGTVLSDDGETLFVQTWRDTEDKNQLHAIDLTKKGAKPKALFTAWDARWYPIAAEGGRVWLWTTLDAPRGRIVSINVKDPTKLSEIVPQADRALESASVVGERLVLSYLEDARSVVRTFTLEGNPAGEVALPGIGSAWGFSGRLHEPVAYYGFASFTTPPSIFRYDASTGETVAWRQPDVPFDPALYEVSQVLYASKDGTKVPMFLAHKRGLALDGSNPTLLYGYGGFNVSMTPWFSVSNLVWMERGGVFAMPGLRGGGEYGEEWHQAGTKERKQNVFDDFIAAAEWLIQQRYTRPDKLAISGGSNGGLLVGATLLQRPELFGAALPAVGVMDMLRYHEFTIGRAWAADYGTAEDPELFKVLYAYSPVHNAVPGKQYPATLITTADHDDRVVPAHSYKFAAALQHAQAGPDPVLIRIETRGGHGAGRSRSMKLDEIADAWAFLVKELGME